MNENISIPPIKVAEVFVDGRCVGLLSNVKLRREDGGGFRVEGEWSGYNDVLDRENSYTISIPRYDCRFLAEKVDSGKLTKSGRISFNEASFLPDGPKSWLETFGEPGEA